MHIVDHNAYIRGKITSYFKKSEKIILYFRRNHFIYQKDFFCNAHIHHKNRNAYAYHTSGKSQT